VCSKSLIVVRGEADQISDRNRQNRMLAPPRRTHNADLAHRAREREKKKGLSLIPEETRVIETAANESRRTPPTRAIPITASSARLPRKKQLGK